MQTLLNQTALNGSFQDRLPVTIAERTRRVYDMLAGVYPLSTMFFHSKAHRCVLEDLRIRNGMRILEVATGSGEMFRHLVKANRSGTTVGLDLSPNMAAKTQRDVRKSYPDAEARCQAVDARYLPFRDNSFDAVVCCYLLELLSTEDIHRTLGEMQRVLQPGGHLSLVLIGQNTDLFNRAYKVASTIVPAFWGRQIEQRVPEFLISHRLRVQSDRVVRQTGYPSRILTARKHH
jgi:ubiquinone/menaquinone biosynthesis C-methylase UbiE